MKKFLGVIVLGLMFCGNGYASDFNIFNSNKIKHTNPMSFIQSNDFDNFIDSNVPNLNFYFGNARNKKKLTIKETFIQFLIPGDRMQNDDNYYVYEGCRSQSCPEKALVWVDKKKEIMIGLILHYKFDDLGSRDGYFLIFSKQINNPKKLPIKFIESLKQWNFEQTVYDFSSGKDKTVIPEVIRFINFNDKKVIDITDMDLLNK